MEQKGEHVRVVILEYQKFTLDADEVRAMHAQVLAKEGKWKADKEELRERNKTALRQRDGWKEEVRRAKSECQVGESETGHEIARWEERNCQGSSNIDRRGGLPDIFMKLRGGTFAANTHRPNSLSGFRAS